MGRNRGRNKKKNRELKKNTEDPSQEAPGCSNSNSSKKTDKKWKKNGHTHPPHLKGKEIGLFYRDKNIKNNVNKKKIEQRVNLIKISKPTEQRISNLIGIPDTDSLKIIKPNTFAGQDFISLRSPLLDKIKLKGDTISDDPAQDIESKYMHMNDSQFKKKFLKIISGNLEENLQMCLLTNKRLKRDDILDRSLLEDLNQKKNSREYKNILRFREKLPAFKRRHEILESVNNNQVIVISGETGCGKTTQVAQFILDNEIEENKGSVTNIICTQPRRISAVSVAERVASERAEKIGDSVGFQIRLEKVLPRGRGSILFCTTAMLLQFMQSDAALLNYSHIIIDEIHERSTHSDFIITLLKQIAPKRPNLKIILMSATLNSEQFSKYFNNCPMMHIPGFTYPVEELYLEDVLAITNFRFPESNAQKVVTAKGNRKKLRKEEQKAIEFEEYIGPYIRNLRHTGAYAEDVLYQLFNPKSEELSTDLICALLKHICFTKGPGAVLIFLPGMMDISKLHRMILDCGAFPSDRYIIHPLHSRMPTVDQKSIFTRPPHGVRKIIIATSIAETSITIEDVVYVIDCGKTKLSRFDTLTNMETLEPEWETEANAKQRRGRAGRVQPGICYHLFTKARAYTFEKFPVPEMLITRLEEVILQLKILQLGKAQDFLSNVMDPPAQKAIEISLDLLLKLNALDKNENLTPLGYHLAQLPLDPRTGKMILWAAMFSCVDPVFSIAASLAFKDAFYCPLGMENVAQKKKEELGMNKFSDHLALAEALKRFEQFRNNGQAWQFCRNYFLSFNTLKLLSQMKSQFTRYLYDMKFLNSLSTKDDSSNINSNNTALVKAIVCAGLYPNVAIVKKAKKSGVTAITIEKEKVKLHPSSINSKATDFPSPYLTYFVKRKSSAIYILDSTSVSPLTLLFASPTSSIYVEKDKFTIKLGSDLSFGCEMETALIIQKLNEKLDNILESKISHPGIISWNDYEGKVLRAIMILLSEGDENLGFKSENPINPRFHTWDNFDEDDIEINDD